MTEQVGSEVGSGLAEIVNSEKFTQEFKDLTPSRRTALYRDLSRAADLVNNQRRELAFAGLASRKELIDIIIDNRKYFTTGSFAKQHEVLRLFRQGKVLLFPDDADRVRLPKPVQGVLDEASRHIRRYGDESVVNLCDYDVYRLSTYGVFIDERLIQVNTIPELRNFHLLLSSRNVPVFLAPMPSKDESVQLLNIITQRFSEWDAIVDEPQQQKDETIQ
ncbi:hypothetical protein A3A54_01265 [Candidatus Curtissbacteria bacterium RIFCSPLOWO2_01_FULL_39_62]|uniref:Uncharacterized protein n=2 Tax=Candidatus Curtissiibacteriota TaxID=1752717 RepID=A0A1F5G7R1_9BACT|nr:MAG: hypothetical protein A2775_01235 [Candidatus Curtissbacteria bacterium RIFCSPHIGHO2_01_FULL_39_57]OGD87891.1 MAG: hypothetical protein A3D04_01765 [Candidatus Curtissbacteria bacterium RIFCSPHIGHO2_02_FULL_40_16b]OGD90308.1 MAG: hypothetical protein A3E11_01245 [Candidatus Curtissbacteria bacterium RIFCSPHIGHO2_12_FULL_38_37]OGD99479.1 MAG: hypothetical protein A3J17_01795 [Candidatus Curtissbacteria bacterium RIFCSPLOWO2_02_FULL_40_11]OGE01968.1 MAG: hypothetical protein A3A54_01265 [C